MILNSQASLQLGEIPFLIGQQSRSDVATDWWIEALAEGATLGNPQPVTETIQTLLADGSLVVTRSHDNREASFQLRVNAPDGALLAEAEAALFLECSRLNELTWTPPDGYGATTVFRVVTSSLEHEFDDFNELRLMRAYTIRLICEPFGRSLNEVVETAAVATGGADTQINACDSTTGWTAAGGTLSVDTTYKAEGSGALKIVPGSSEIVPVDGGSSYQLTTDVTYTLAGLSLNLSTTPFVAVKVWTRYSQNTQVTCSVDGQSAPLVASRMSTATNGPWTTFYFYSADTSVASLAFKVRSTATFPASGLYSVVAPTAPDWAPRIDDVRRSGTAPTASTTGRERTMLIPVSGSARTQGSLSVQHETQGLGDVLIYTNPMLSPTGYTPDVARWTVSYSAITSTANTLSGNYVTLNAGTPWRIEVPAASLPRGGYLVVARAQCNATKTVTVDASTLVGTAVVGTQHLVSAPFDTGLDFGFRVLGSLTLPPTDVPDGSAAMIRLDVKDPTSGASTVYVDELLLLAVNDESAVTIVRCGHANNYISLGDTNSRLWLDAPSLTSPVPQVFMGTKADRTDAYNAGDSVDAFGVHQFTPPYTLAFVANGTGTNPAVSYRHAPRWHTHAAS